MKVAPQEILERKIKMREIFKDYLLNFGHSVVSRDWWIFELSLHGGSHPYESKNIGEARPEEIRRADVEVAMELLSDPEIVAVMELCQ